MATRPALSTDLGDPLKMLSHDYGFFSGNYTTWSTARGIGETAEIFVENALWDSSITDTFYSLPSNHITALYADESSGLYMGTTKGLAYFDGSSFTDLSEDVGGRVEDLSGSGTTLWIGSKDGLYSYINDSFSLVLDKSITAVGAGTGTVWVGTPEGLYAVDISDGSSTSYPFSDTLNSPASNNIRDIELDASGNPWLATDKGISYLDENGAWQIISSLHNLISDNVYDLTFVSDGIWVGTDKGLAFYVDASTFDNYDRKNSGLSTNGVQKVKVNDSIRWMATGDGFFRFEGDYGWTHFGMDHRNYLEAHTTDTLNSLNVRDLAFMDDDIYVATSWGLTRYGLTDGSWETWRGPYQDETVYADSALVPTVLEAWENKTPGLDASHYFYHGLAEALGVEEGGDTLGIYEEVTRLFGDVSDVDQNGKVTVFLMDVRDNWDDKAGALDGVGNQTYDGYILTRNLFSVEPTMRKDLLYIDVRRQSQVEVEMALTNTLTKHILYNHDPGEETWVSEGMGMMAEILTGYGEYQSEGFKGFEVLNYPAQNSILSWETGNPYQDREFAELLLLFLAEKHPTGDDGGLGIILDVARNSSEHGIDAFNTALSNSGSSDTFSDVFLELGITAIIESQKLATMLDHPDYGFSYHDVGGMTGYNTIYWGLNQQDSPPYMGILPQWSSRVFNGRTRWIEVLKEFELVKFNGADDNHFRVALILNSANTPDSASVVVEIALDDDGEAIYRLIEAVQGYKSFSVIYVSDSGDGTAVTQMVMSQDVVSPDAFGGVKVGVAQNSLDEQLIDVYVTSLEGLCKDVGDATFSDDGGLVTIEGPTGSSVIPMEKVLEDESHYTFTYEFTYEGSTSVHTATTSEFFLYHAEHVIPAEGDYTITAGGQDVSGNDVRPDATVLTVGSVGSSARTIAHGDGQFSVSFDQGSVVGKHRIMIVPSVESGAGENLSDLGFIDPKSENIPLSGAYRVGPQSLHPDKPVTVRFGMDLTRISEEDRPYVGIYRYSDGGWMSLPTQITSSGAVLAKTDKLGTFQIQKGVSVVDQAVLPADYVLHQNYPNPFNPSTEIRFDLPEDARVTIDVFNVLGQRVAVIAEDRFYSAGYHSVRWDGIGGSGKPVSSGLYVYAIQAGPFTATRKMILVR